MMPLKLNQINNMPNMSGTLNGWMNTITLVIISQTVVNGIPTNTQTTATYRGVVQPLSPEQVNLKPEGQRSWEWLQIHVQLGGRALKNDDRIIYNDKKFKVMARKDYTLNGYIEYHIVEDYTS